MNQKAITAIMTAAALPLLLTALRVLSASSYNLEIGYAVSTPPDPWVDSEAVVKATIRNKGSEISGPALLVLKDTACQADGFELFKMSDPTAGLASFAPGASVEISCRGKFTKLGSKNFTFKTNTLKRIEEADLTNNATSTRVLVRGQDLKADGLAVSPAYTPPGQKCYVIARVINSGTEMIRSYSGLTDYEYDFGDFIVSGVTHTVVDSEHPLTSTSTFEIKFLGHFPTPGKRSLSFEADTADQYEEKFEDNNKINTTYTTASSSSTDLTVDKIEFDPQEPIVNESVKIIVSVKNSGGTSLIYDDGLKHLDVGYSYDGIKDISLGSFELPTIDNPFDPKEIQKYVFTALYNQAGLHKFAFTADRAGVLREASEANNTKSKETSVFLTPQDRDALEILSYRHIIVSSSSGIIKWTTDRNSSGEVIYGDARGVLRKLKKSSNTATTTHSVTLTDLKPGTITYYNIHALLGTVLKATAEDSFPMPMTGDMKITAGPAEIPNPRAAQIEVSWNTDIGANSFVYFRNRGVEKFEKAGNETVETRHTVYLAKLKAGDYEYYTYSKNAMGVAVKSAIKAIRLEPPPKTPVPTSASSTSAAGPGASNSSSAEPARQDVKNLALYTKLKGKIILRIAASGKAYYVDPASKSLYYLGRPADAFSVMRARGIGAADRTLAGIPIGLAGSSAPDSDKDLLPDLLETALGTDPLASDTDRDGYGDGREVINGYDPKLKMQKARIDPGAAIHKGKIFLQVEGRGEAWYVNPADGKRYFLGRPADAFSVMRSLGLGISESDFNSLQ